MVWSFAAVLAASSVALGPARADPVPARPADPQQKARDTAAARALFDAARKLMLAGAFVEACPKLEEGMRLMPGLGMKFNLAECYENLGRLASAWGLYLDVAGAAKEKHDAEREGVARGRAQALEGRLSYLTVDLDPGTARLTGLTITRDGTPLGRGQLGSAVPVDPGAHVIHAEAPGRKPWNLSLKVAPEGVHARVKVPLLVLDEPPPAPPLPAAAPEPKVEDRTVSPWVWACGGLAIVGLGVGSYFGIRAISLGDESNEHCRGSVCDGIGFDARNDARAAGNWSTGMFTIGVLAGGAAAALWFLGPRGQRTTSGARVAPWAAARGAGGFAEVRW